jgi:hypothetical protein
MPAAGVPWYVWACTIATTSAVAGAIWDISWHQTVGRDTFWTAPHVLIQLCGVIAGFACGYLILATTFDRQAALRSAAIRVWGFRGPLGAFLCAWGGIAMIASAPFDDWWHNAYGLDVKILSPPHVVLLLGILGVRVGTLLLMLAARRRARPAARTVLTWLFLFVGGALAGATLGAFQEMMTRNLMHSARFYFVAGLVAPLILIAIGIASGHRWGASLTAAFAMLPRLVTLWILPLFPAEPMLGPVYQEVDRFIPMEFPILWVAAGLAFDLARPWIAKWNPWAQSAVAAFLQSAGARNWFFGAHYIPYFVPPWSDYARHAFTPVEPTATVFWAVTVAGFAAAILSARGGLAWGGLLARIER